MEEREVEKRRLMLCGGACRACRKIDRGQVGGSSRSGTRRRWGRIRWRLRRLLWYALLRFLFFLLYLCGSSSTNHNFYRVIYKAASKPKKRSLN